MKIEFLKFEKKLRDYKCNVFVYSPIENYFVVASDNLILVLDSTTLKEIFKLEDPTGKVTDLKFSKSGRLLASTSSDHSIKIWNFKTKLLEASLIGHKGAITSIDISKDEKEITSGSEDQMVLVWSL